MNKPLLAIDTSSFAASLAVLGPEGMLGEVGLRTRKPSRTLLPALGRLLDALDLEAADLEAVAMTTGPGSFTGLRVGMAAGQGYAQAAGLPVVGVGTLDAVAGGACRLPAPLAVVRDARRGRVYAATYTTRGGRPLRTSPVVDVDAAEWLSRLPWPATLVGDAVDACPDLLAHAPRGSRLGEAPHFLAGPAARLARLRLDQEGADRPGSLRAAYIRPPDARLPPPEKP